MTSGNDNSSLPRRTIGELLTRYVLEPNLRDLFVEGSRDRSLYDWYLRKCAYKDVAVFAVDSVEITQETLELHGLGNGNRSRLIGLALELDGQFPVGLKFVRCVVDSDFDFIFESSIHSTHLLYTDYTSVDLYTFEEDLLEKVLTLGFTFSTAQVRTLSDAMTPILQELFIVRAANEKLGWSMTLPRLPRHCKIEGLRINFDRNGFVNGYLDSGSKRKERETFDTLCDELRLVSLSDPREGIHGEDYLELLGWYLRRQRGWGGYTRGQRSAMTVLLPALDERRLCKEELFVQLSTVFGDPQWDQ